MSATGAAIAAPQIVGPLERRYRASAAFRAASETTRLTPTHWHIAAANGLGWMFDGMDGLIFGLSTPLVMKDFGVNLPQLRTGAQIALLIGVAGMFVWPWLADRYGRRTLLALNIAMFSLCMPLAAVSPTWGFYIGARSLIYFALNGEWALGSMLVAETWPANLRGRVIGINRGTWCFGASAAGVVGAVVIAHWGWRVACLVPAVIALLAVYVRWTCPESPYWVRTQDRKQRIAEAKAAGAPLLAEDAAWLAKAQKVPLRQIFLADMIRNTGVATFIACCSTIIYGTVGGWMPLYLATERHWSTGEYSSFYIWWGLVGFLGLLIAGWVSDRFGRRPAFYLMLAEGAVFVTLWVHATTDTELWVYGLLWSVGFLGFWAPAMTLTAEVFPTRIRGAGNGFCWAVAWVVGFILWPFVTVYIQQRTGSFDLAFMAVPVAMALMAGGVWLFVPDHAGKDLDAIGV